MHFKSQAEYLRFLRSAPAEPEKYIEAESPEPIKDPEEGDPEGDAEKAAGKKRGKKA